MKVTRVQEDELGAILGRVHTTWQSMDAGSGGRISSGGGAGGDALPRFG